MKDCNEYEIELSAIIDGESDPLTAVELLDHISTCSSCRSFFTDLRQFQETVDDVKEQPAENPQPVPRARRLLRWGWTPRWGLGLAAIAVVLMWAGGLHELGNLSQVDPRGREVVIDLGQGGEKMDEERFIGLLTEMLKADRIYQEQMLVVLDELRDDVGSIDVSSVSWSERGITRYDFPRPTEAERARVLN